jgi:hypothetical protein
MEKKRTLLQHVGQQMYENMSPTQRENAKCSSEVAASAAAENMKSHATEAAWQTPQKTPIRVTNGVITFEGKRITVAPYATPPGPRGSITFTIRSKRQRRLNFCCSCFRGSEGKMSSLTWQIGIQLGVKSLAHGALNSSAGGAWHVVSPALLWK